jgi:hypothetical protein
MVSTSARKTKPNYFYFREKGEIILCPSVDISFLSGIMVCLAEEEISYSKLKHIKFELSSTLQHKAAP